MVALFQESARFKPCDRCTLHSLLLSLLLSWVLKSSRFVSLAFDVRTYEAIFRHTTHARTPLFLGVHLFESDSLDDVQHKQAAGGVHGLLFERFDFLPTQTRPTPVHLFVYISLLLQQLHTHIRTAQTK
jgi:hypothetical protein